MSYGPLTNQMAFDLDPDKYSACFDVVRADVSRDTYKLGGRDTYSQAIKAIHAAFSGPDRSRILALQYGTGDDRYSSTLYALLDKRDDNGRLIYDARSQHNASHDVTVRLIKDLRGFAEDIEGERILQQLLLNMLGSRQNGDNHCAVLRGRLYWFNPLDLVCKDDDKYPDQVKALELLIDSRLRLHLNVRTFTDVRFINPDPKEEKKGMKLVFTKKRPFESYPRYSISYAGGPHMKPKEEGDEGHEYILKQFPGSKSSTPFLDLTTLDDFCKSKVGILHDVMSRYSLRYNDLGGICFVPLGNLFASAKMESAANDDFYEVRLKNLVQQRSILVIDKVSTAESQELVNSLIKGIQVLYGVTAHIASEPAEGCLNIVLIHDAAYYDKESDLHGTSMKAALQHITMEKCGKYKGYCSNTAGMAPNNAADLKKSLGGLRSVIQVVLANLIIKQDIIDERLSTYDWLKLGFKDTVSFVSMSKDDEDNETYFMISVSPDGKISKYCSPECPEFLSLSPIDWDAAEGAVAMGEDIVNTITDEDLYTLPEDMDGIHDYLQSHPKSTERDENGKLIKSKEGIRNKENKRMYTSLLDIQYVKESEDTAYVFAGVKGSGMEYVMHNCVRIRKIEAAQGSLFYDRLLPTMTVPFVCNRQRTVLPFLFKYLRELVNMETGNDDIEEDIQEDVIAEEEE